jgi:hypothetical protein
MSSPTTQVPSPNDVFGPEAAVAGGAAAGAGAGAGTSAAGATGPALLDVGAGGTAGVDLPLFPIAGITKSTTNNPPRTHGHLRFFGAGGGAGCWP